ncbi:MAG: HD domain-containing protein [Lachnospiraceae bacterium]|nr:HD domain-containing protein [Lachnospiraceae bacterium]
MCAERTPLAEDEAHIAAEIREQISALSKEGRLAQTTDYIQHGTVSVYEHCLSVTRCSCHIARLLRIPIDRRSLIRGALLHDYFLYDWHEKGGDHRLHGFHHPARALKNAREDFNLTNVESNIILRHMFPLVPVPPTFREGWIVCLADKVCATKETLFCRS